MVQTPLKPETETLVINLPTTINLYVTVEQFTALAATNRDLRLERNAKGELIVNPPTGWETGKQNLSISGELYLWWRNLGDGQAFDSSTGFILSNGAIYSPDASWISQQRWETLTSEEKTTFPKICPDFVVELKSKSDRLSLLQTKMKEYINHGTKLGWLINPQQRQVEIYRSNLEVEILDNPTQLSGEQILSSFVLNLNRVWG